MKAVTNKFAPLTKTVLEQLTTEVKETLVPASELNQHKNFSAADLWNIQRQYRQRATRRFL